MRMAWLVFLPLSVLADEPLIADESNFNPVLETVSLPALETVDAACARDAPPACWPAV